MARLICKFKKDDPPFIERADARHDGRTDMTISEQREGMEFIITSLQDLCEDLQRLGYDTTTIYFSVKTNR